MSNEKEIKLIEELFEKAKEKDFSEIVERKINQNKEYFKKRPKELLSGTYLLKYESELSKESEEKMRELYNNSMQMDYISKEIMEYCEKGLLDNVSSLGVIRGVLHNRDSFNHAAGELKTPKLLEAIDNRENMDKTMMWVKEKDSIESMIDRQAFKPIKMTETCDDEPKLIFYLKDRKKIELKHYSHSYDYGDTENGFDSTCYVMKEVFAHKVDYINDDIETINREIRELSNKLPPLSLFEEDDDGFKDKLLINHKIEKLKRKKQSLMDRMKYRTWYEHVELSPTFEKPVVEENLVTPEEIEVYTNESL